MSELTTRTLTRVPGSASTSRTPSTPSTVWTLSYRWETATTSSTSGSGVAGWISTAPSSPPETCGFDCWCEWYQYVPASGAIQR